MYEPATRIDKTIEVNRIMAPRRNAAVPVNSAKIIKIDTKKHLNALMLREA